MRCTALWGSMRPSVLTLRTGTRAATAHVANPPSATAPKITSVVRVPDSYPFNERSVRWNGYAIDLPHGKRALENGRVFAVWNEQRLILFTTENALLK